MGNVGMSVWLFATICVISSIFGSRTRYYRTEDEILKTRRLMLMTGDPRRKLYDLPEMKISEKDDYGEYPHLFTRRPIQKQIIKVVRRKTMEPSSLNASSSPINLKLLKIITKNVLSQFNAATMKA